MTITEVLHIIHKERIEVEVFENLSKWMIEDRATWIDKAIERRSIISAISKIAKENKNKKEAIEGIIALSEEDDE